MTKIALGMLVLPLLIGCHGFAPLWSQANPETSLEIDPIRHRVLFYSNDGRALKANNLKFEKRADGTLVFSCDTLDCSERSVENRMANVAQMEASALVTREIMAPVNHLVDGVLALAGRGSSSSLSVNPLTGDISGTRTTEPAVLPPAPEPQPVVTP